MQFFYSSNASQANAISIPNDFIEKFVPTAEPLFTAVYIYTLYKCVQNEPCDSISLASVFHLQRMKLMLSGILDPTNA